MLKMQSSRLVLLLELCVKNNDTHVNPVLTKFFFDLACLLSQVNVLDGVSSFWE